MEEGQDLDYWDEQESQIKSYDKPMDDKLLDDDNQEEECTERQTPEGQVNIFINLNAQKRHM